MPGQTVQTQIRLLLEESLIRVYTVCHSDCIVWTHYSMVEPHSSNFRVITTIFLGVRIFRKFTVVKIWWKQKTSKKKKKKSLFTRKPVFRVSDQVILKPACSATETNVNILVPENEFPEIIYAFFGGRQNIFSTIFGTKFFVKCATKILKIG